MKESHLFYAPDLKSTGALPADEAAHAVRVLRMQEGDALWATDGCGSFYDCHIVSIVPGRKPECFVEIDCERSWQRPWHTEVCVAVAPTNMRIASNGWLRRPQKSAWTGCSGWIVLFRNGER